MTNFVSPSKKQHPRLRYTKILINYVVIDSKENSFSVNYVLIKKIPSVLIKALNEYYSFNFYNNFIKIIIITIIIIIIIIIISEENVLCCLRLKGDVQ